MQAGLPLTPTQQGMLFHQWQSGRHTGVDIEQIVVGFDDEPIDVAAMRAAWQAAVERHASLRTRFVGTGIDEPSQVVQARVELPFEVEDWRDSPAAAHDATFEARLAAWRREGFDLHAAPLMRVALLRTGETAWRMVWMVHHAVCDGRSFAIVLSQVLAHHDALRAGRAVEHVAATDVAEHVCKTVAIARDQTSAAEAFWRQRLNGLAAAPLPARSSAAGHTGDPASNAEPSRGHVEATVPDATLDALHTATERSGPGLAAIVQGAWAVVLARFTGEDDVVFGAVRSGRSNDAASRAMVGCLINTLPVRVVVDGAARADAWLAELRQREREVRAFETSALMDVQRWSGAMSQRAGQGLFDTVVIYDHLSLDAQMRRISGAVEPGARDPHQRRRFRLIEQTPYPVTLYAWGESPMLLRLAFDERLISAATARRLLGGFVRVLESIAADPLAALDSIDILTTEDTAALRAWNDTRMPLPSSHGIAAEFEAQVRRTPHAIAVASGDATLTYDALNRRANRLAFHLMGLGVGPDVPVAVLLSRSTDLMVAILAVLKAGGGWLPLDPGYPRERLAYKLADAGARVLITQQAHAALLDTRDVAIVRIDDEAAFEGRPDHDPATAGDASRLAYLIYTSGSTGKPKGVMVEQRQVSAFFAAMDACIPRSTQDTEGAQDTWLAVTSLAFDISVLELLWTLTRGFRVVIHEEHFGAAPGTRARPHDDRGIAFSLMYFASAASAGADPYKLLLEGAKFADAHGFEAVWTPERHFHDFGGLYPNPAVTSAVIAAVTKRVHIRAGSVVAALHHPARIAEEWAMADNLSGGRVGISFASGWQPRDFVLAPHAFETARETMLATIDQVRRLWRGEALSLPGPKGPPAAGPSQGGRAPSGGSDQRERGGLQMHDVRTLPRPIQPELPIWLTAAGAPQTFRDAGTMGAGVLTHLLGQTLDEVAQKIAVYRDAWRTAGHAGNGHVTMMLHSFVGDSTDAVRETVRQPMVDYLASSLGLVKGFAAQWSAFKKGAGSAADNVDIETLSADERHGLLNYAFERYFETSGLFGDEERALDMADRLKGIGVDEIACLIDFGVDEDTTLAHLRNLARVRERAQPMPVGETGLAGPSVAPGRPKPLTAPSGGSERSERGGLLSRHGVTHLQCTPSLASALLLDDAFVERLPQLRAMLLGGEALPPSLAAALLDAGLPTLINMYGPTETTIWSATHDVTRDDAQADTIPIGRPIANTVLHVVDRRGRLVPPGVAGELCIGGAGVVRGYHARPELTAERFVPDPFTAGAAIDDATPRMYRTGDLARRRDDGALEFLGRLDHQVKIRGYRIELGEIEATLAAQPGVRECVVVAREDTPGVVRLVAYVVPTDAAVVFDAHALRDALRASLPEAMVPSHVVALPALPQTPNRKIDRKALPSPEAIAAAAPPSAGNGTTRPGHGSEPAPRDAAASPLERQIAAVWQQVLGAAKVGLDDNFFDLGGHSLLAVKAHRVLLAEVPQAASGALVITDLFRYPSVRALARRLEGQGPAGASAAVQASSDRAAQRRQALAARRGQR
jgi:non-ribosomal peptide synthetase component F/alkanesulfonate monooxygenase SsuD/methylene tetrahydromethanopterin reductase-like flavin-dependent oxidoreductase (luciferase family)